MGQISQEVDHCKPRLAKFCQGQGLDLGCGYTKIKTDAIGIDLYSPAADMNKDVRLLSQYPDNHFDYIFSSHLLEELDNTEGILKEWLRVIKEGGNIVLYQADKTKYWPLGDPRCNRNHRHHFDIKDLWEIFLKIGGVELIHSQDSIEKEWSFEMVVKKAAPSVRTAPNLIPQNNGISILVPTLKRPQNIEQLTLSIDKTTKNYAEVELLFGIHENDLASKNKIEELQSKVKIGLRYEFVKNPDYGINLSHLWNQLYAKAKYPILGFFGDDVAFRTPGWDLEVQKEFNKDKVILLSCNDVHIQKGKDSILFFTHRSVHEKIGFYMNEKLRRWYIDTFLDTAFKRIGRVHYREDIVTEHFNPASHREKNDEVFDNLKKLVDADKGYWNTIANKKDIEKVVTILKSLI